MLSYEKQDNNASLFHDVKIKGRDAPCLFSNRNGDQKEFIQLTAALPVFT